LIDSLRARPRRQSESRGKNETDSMSHGRVETKNLVIA
jgi:hypothetical protein